MSKILERVLVGGVSASKSRIEISSGKYEKRCCSLQWMAKIFGQEFAEKESFVNVQHPEKMTIWWKELFPLSASDTVPMEQHETFKPEFGRKMNGWGWKSSLLLRFFLLFFHESHSPPSPCLTLSQIGNWGFLHLRSLGIMLFHHHHGWCGSCCCFFIILPLSKIFFLQKSQLLLWNFEMQYEWRKKSHFSGGLHIFTKVLNDSLLFSIISSSLLPGVLVEFLTNWKLMLLVSS